jgi:hypothetical protein
MLVLTRIKADELNGLALIPEAEEGKFLVEGCIGMVSFEVVVEGPSEGVVIVVAGDGVIPEIGFFLLDFSDS